jgi:hypothetical protein
VAELHRRVRPRLVKLLVDPAAKLTALRVNIAIRPQRIGIGLYASRGPEPAIESAVRVTG